MIITQYDVGPGAYGATVAPDGAVWTTLVERAELVRISSDGDITRLSLDEEQARPMVLTVGSDDAVWFSRGDGRIGRVDPSGELSSRPVLTPTGSPYGLCAGPNRTIWYTLISGDRIGRISPDGAI